jgi:hypothetical protein
MVCQADTIRAISPWEIAEIAENCYILIKSQQITDCPDLRIPDVLINGLQIAISNYK